MYMQVHAHNNTDFYDVNLIFINKQLPKSYAAGAQEIEK
jgi:hypothetical protein